MARRRRKEFDSSLDASMEFEANSQQENNKLRKITLANYGNVLQNKHARELVWEILSYAELYNVDATSGEAALVNAGSRKVGVSILALLEEIDPAMYPKLILERGSDHGRGKRDDDRTDDSEHYGYPDGTESDQ
jgi:hypothetical protein